MPRSLPMLAGLLLGALAMLPAAQARPVPPGPYLSSCRNPEVVGSYLYATCRQQNGEARVSRLRLPYRCPAAITSDDGWLHCNPAPVLGE